MQRQGIPASANQGIIVYEASQDAVEAAIQQTSIDKISPDELLQYDKAFQAVPLGKYFNLLPQELQRIEYIRFFYQQ